MWSDNETSEDLLGFKVHADLLLNVVKDETILPVTIGVFGDWGSGKSSIMKILEKELENDEETLSIYFNGWTFEGYDDAKAALLSSILKELSDDKKLGNKVTEEVKKQAKKLLGSIDWMRILGMTVKNIAIPALSASFSGGFSLIPFALKKISDWGIDSKTKVIKKLENGEVSDLLSSFVKETEDKDNEKSNAIANFKRDFEELLLSTSFKRLVVLIDDLDRCTPDRIIENLEAIKLFLNVPKTAFIIGADPRIVRHAIEYRYKSTNKLDDENSRIIEDYIEK